MVLHTPLQALPVSLLHILRPTRARARGTGRLAIYIYACLLWAVVNYGTVHYHRKLCFTGC